MAARTLDDGRPRIAVIGAGMSGINMALVLKDKLKYDNFVIIEKCDVIGGTWRDNVYPGCGSDVPGHFYSLSTELNPEWDTYYVSQPEILAYWKNVWAKHHLSDYTWFNTEVISVAWNADRNAYRLQYRNTKTDELKETWMEVVIGAAGPFPSALIPSDLKGLENFKGLSWHSLTWRHDVDLKGKRIGVIGNGCSACQFIPHISADPSVQVINFCRTPSWFSPREQSKYPGWVKWIFRNIPGAMRTYRNLMMLSRETVYFGFVKDSLFMRKLVLKLLTKYLKDNAPKEYHDRLIPSYPPGCKRIIVDPGYLQALHRPNVSLEWNGIEEVLEDGVRLKSGEFVPLDIIIFGTGFEILNRDMPIFGIGGKPLMEYFDDKDGPTAYLGTAYPDFPNFFTIIGPNVATGHSSILFAAETQAHYIAQVLAKTVLSPRSGARSVTPKAAATDAHNEWVQERLKNTVWTECLSYYRRVDREGKGSGRNAAIFPGTMIKFWRMMRKVRWTDWNVQRAS